MLQSAEAYGVAKRATPRCKPRRPGQAGRTTPIVHYDDAEDREMTEDRTGHNGEREAGAEPCGPRKQNQNCRDQFGNARTNATPRFEFDYAEDINGFRRG